MAGRIIDTVAGKVMLGIMSAGIAAVVAVSLARGGYPVAFMPQEVKGRVVEERILPDNTYSFTVKPYNSEVTHEFRLPSVTNPDVESLEKKLDLGSEVDVSGLSSMNSAGNNPWYSKITTKGVSPSQVQVYK